MAKTNQLRVFEIDALVRQIQELDKAKNDKKVTPEIIDDFVQDNFPEWRIIQTTRKQIEKLHKKIEEVESDFSKTVKDLVKDPRYYVPSYWGENEFILLFKKVNNIKTLSEQEIRDKIILSGNTDLKQILEDLKKEFDLG